MRKADYEVYYEEMFGVPAYSLVCRLCGAGRDVWYSVDPPYEVAEHARCKLMIYNIFREHVEEEHPGYIPAPPPTSPPGALVVKVVDKDTNLPITKARVTVEDDDYYTGEDGTVEVTGLHAEPYRVVVSMSGYDLLPFQVTITAAATTKVTVVLKKLPSDASATGTLILKVVDEYDGLPLRGARVTVGGKDYYTGEDGTVEVRGLPPGKLYVSIMDLGLLDIFPVTIKAGATTSITVKEWASDNAFFI
ncbi:MAG: carboxypeptidase regulatory-like domain-containing protein [Candidatus Hadarchaeales archaeon]